MSINKLKNISTKLGDSGTSKNFNNETYRKSDILFETLGSIDELSSYLGLAYHFYADNDIKEIQKNLQCISSQIATSPDSVLGYKIDKLEAKSITNVESKMEMLLKIKPLEARLYLPGSEKSKAGAHLDVCRTLARRAERRLDEFVNKYSRIDLNLVRSYLNRLSDYLFVLSFNI